MSSLESRTELVSKLIGELVREIIGSKDEKVLQSSEQQALNIIRNHRSISINRYEVRRKLDNLKQKFVVDNFKEYADHLERLCNVVLNHPLCLQHYEVDIQWSLLELLFSLAYNPTGSLRRNQHKIVIESPEKTRENTFAKLEELYLKSVLKEDFISVQNFDENSDLSDWSCSEAEEETVTETNQNQSNISNGKESNTCDKPVFLLPFLPPLQPPMKQQPYLLIEDEDNLKDRLKERVQHTWWLSGEHQNVHQEISKRKEANFAVLLADYVRKRTNSYLSFREPSIIPEFCLLRELLWVFYLPQKCKFFSINSGKCKLHKNVTIPSISAPTLAEYLEHNILPYVDKMHALCNFLRDVHDCQDQKLSRTFEYYAANLKGLLDPILDRFVKLEDRIVKQESSEINTLITLQSSTQDILEQLQIIHALHEAVVLDFRKYPAHITSSFMLTALMRFSNTATTATESNLAISLFLASINAFCNIIDSWWNEGRLDDWQNEFLVECSSDQSISFRLYSKDEDKAFFVPKHISKTIGENRFLHLLQEHSVEAAYTLNLLYEISRIGDLRNDCGAVGKKLYNALIDDVFCQVGEMGMGNETDCVDIPQADITDGTIQQDFHDNSYENLTTTDEFLLLLFGSTKTGKDKLHNRDTCDAAEVVNEQRTDALQMFKKLEKCKHMLPLEEMILSSFERILRERITSANMFVVDLYRGKVDILGHLRNIRKVLLLEASDVMQQFYSKLFKQMEAGQPWANAFVLTILLDDTISSKYPEMSSLFRIELNSAARVQTQKVTEAVEALTVSYSFSNELAKIITAEDMQVYNEVFRFILKVKWGLATLENLKFSRTRKRPPYTPLEMGDFLMRRLEQLRFWMFYGVQCVHSHLMTHVLQAMGSQLEEKLLLSTNVREMEAVHKSYLATISEHCFLKDNLSKIKFGIEQMLNLVFVLRSEWKSCLKYLDQCTPLAADISHGTDDLELDDYAITAEIDTIELTYIRCHQYLANMLNNEVYIYQNSFLSGLSAAFNTSLPC